MALGPIKYAVLKQTNPRLNLERILSLKALYYGGSRLLADDAVLTRLLPRYAYEKDGVYAERKRRAYYENIFAQVVNFISAGLAQDPIRLALPKPELDEDLEDEDEEDVEEEDTDEDEEGTKPFSKPKDDEEEDEDTEDEGADDEEDEEEPVVTSAKKPKPKKPKIKKPVEPQVDQYWIDLMDDATPFSEDGSKRKSYDQVIRDACVEALVCGWSWLQSDLPSAPTPVPVLTPEGPALEGPVLPTSLADQERSGALRAYLIPWATECVIDWEEKDGRLLWVKTYQCEMSAPAPDQPRATKVHIYTYWEASSWTRYRIEENQKEHKPLPNDDVMIEPAQGGTGTHSFGRVPWTRLDLCTDEGAQLHLGDQIESLCRAYFNRQNGESYQWVQFYFQQLYEFLAPEMSGIDTPISDAQTDPGRAKRFRAPGEVQVRGHEDKAMFIGPNMSGASEAREATKDMRDSIYRATAQMALSQDTSGAMLRRSGDSKRQDAVAQEIVLGAIGKKLLVLAGAAAELLASGRGDKEAPKLRGYERFDIFDADMLLNRASVVASINIPSATYQVEHLFQVATTDLGDSVDEEVKKKIRLELESALTQDQHMLGDGSDSKDVNIDAEPAPEAPVANSALNGAQIQSLLSLVTSYINKEISRQTAKALILVSFPTIDGAEAEQVLGPENFEAKPPEPKFNPFGGPPKPGAPPFGKKPGEEGEGDEDDKDMPDVDEDKDPFDKEHDPKEKKPGKNPFAKKGKPF